MTRAGYTACPRLASPSLRPPPLLRRCRLPSPWRAIQSPSPPCRNACRSRARPCRRRGPATAGAEDRRASIILAIADAEVRSARTARLTEQRQRPRQADFELGRGIAARDGDHLGIDVLG